MIKHITPKVARLLLTGYLHYGQRVLDQDKVAYWSRVLDGSGAQWWKSSLAYVEVRHTSLKVTDGQHHLEAIARCPLRYVAVNVVAWPESTFGETVSEADQAKVFEFFDSVSNGQFNGA